MIVVCSYIIEDGVTFLTVCGSSYPKKLAFSFLEDIRAAFQEELQTAFGTHAVDYRSIIETIEKPYYFVKFGKQPQLIVTAAPLPPSAESLLHRRNSLKLLPSFPI